MKSRIVWRQFTRLVTGMFIGTGLFSAAQAAETWQFREPAHKSYVTDASPVALQGGGLAAVESIEVYSPEQPAYRFDLTKRVVLRLRKAGQPNEVLGKSPLVNSRVIDERTFVLEAPDAWTAARESARLAALPEVEVCTPIFRRPFTLNGPYAAQYNDPYVSKQWHLENRDTSGNPAGADINVRAAWSMTKGEGIKVAVVDEGVQGAHPDLAAKMLTSLSYNFHNSANSGEPMLPNAGHGTSVAGLIAADSGNGVGVTGVAPAAGMASWVIFNGNAGLSGERLADVFYHEPQQVWVQNHSWGVLSGFQIEPSFLELLALANSYSTGRGGKGVVMVRSGGNNRLFEGNVNDDGYASSQNVIAVGAVRSDGRAASYSSRGAALLVSAPGGDTGTNLVTTDLVGTFGRNNVTYSGDQNNYAFDGTNHLNLPHSGFNGTSGSAPIVSGIVAMMLSVNSNLTVRDVQHILVQSARHVFWADPSIQTNGAGFVTSENVGFGIPDAGVAVKLAQSWSNQPVRKVETFQHFPGAPIPDSPTRLQLLGPNVPAQLQSIQTFPSNMGIRVDKPISHVPLVFVGYATNALAENLTGKAALIERGPVGEFPDQRNTFNSKVQRAADAGAKYVVFFDNVVNANPGQIAVDAYAPLPAVLITRDMGLALTNYLAQEPSATAVIDVPQASVSFSVSKEMICEHVGIRLTADHPRRGDLRITLISPSGTISVLQPKYNSSASGPNGWTYYTTQNYYESSKGTWTIQVTDELIGYTGMLTEVELYIHGMVITDSDGDGLHDDWETTHFGNLAQGPKGDPDGDGWQNAREQVRGTNPLAHDELFQLDVSKWNDKFMRVSWPGAAGVPFTASKLTGANLTPQVLTNVTGRFPVTELFVPSTNTTSGFLLLQRPSP